MNVFLGDIKNFFVSLKCFNDKEVKESIAA